MTPTDRSARCRLCGADTKPFWTSPRSWSYERCPTCRLIQRVAAELPAPEEESARYATHQNSHANDGYVAYQMRFAEATVLARMQPPASILDFGCGPGPVLADLLADRGFVTTSYDPFFFPDKAALERSYDAVCAVEVVEHFHGPAESFTQLGRLVAPGGWLFLRTELFDDDGTADDFARWWYTNDFTHVAFYSPHTFNHRAALGDMHLVECEQGTFVTLRRWIDRFT